MQLEEFGLYTQACIMPGALKSDKHRAASTEAECSVRAEPMQGATPRVRSPRQQPTQLQGALEAGARALGISRDQQPK